MAPVSADVPPVSADGALLERVIANLVGNAVKHTDSEIHITVTKADGGRVEMRVSDHGPGIPRDAWDMVFRPFQRLGDRDNTAGVGLGLALSRGLIEAMDGTLGPEETPGGGVTMVVSLPAAEGSAVPAGSRGDEDDEEDDDGEGDENMSGVVRDDATAVREPSA
jgi:two-component system sensor histidine kinase KdpD